MSYARVVVRSDGWLQLHTPYNAEFVDYLKISIPSIHRKWIPEERVWHVRVDLTFIVDMLEDYFDEVEVVESEARSQERQQEFRRQYQQEWRQRRQNYSAPPPPPPSPPRSDAYSVLFLLPTAPAFLVESTYRTLARHYHPDVCKEPDANERMQKINVAYASLKKRLAT